MLDQRPDSLAARPDEPSSLLIVEDNPAHVALLTRTLHRAFPACSLHTADSLEEALQFLEHQQPDLILCDLRLPGGSGLELLEQSDERGYPIIYMTSLREEQQGVDAIKKGALDYLIKSPDTFDQIPQAIRRAHREWQLRQENRRMQAALAQSEARYRHLFDEAPIMYVLTEHAPEGPIVTHCNAEFLETLGYTRDGVIGQPLASFYDEASRAALQDGGYAAALAGTFKTAARTLVAQDGSPIEAELRAKPDYDLDGKVVGTRAIYINLTPQKQQEQQLLFLQAAATSSADGIAIVDARQPHLPFVYVNKGFEKLTGYTSENVIGRSFALLHNDDTNQPSLQVVYNAFRTGMHCHVVLRNYRKDGTLFMNDLHLSPIIDNQGELTHFVGIQRDVTKKYTADQELARLRTFYEAILDQAPAQIAVFDNEARYIYINRASVGDPELRTWLLGKTPTDYAAYRNLDPAAFEERTAWLKRCIQDATPSQHEEVIPTRQGDKHHILRMTVPLHNEQGEMEGMVGYGVDLTAIRRAESALRESQEFIKGIAQAMPHFLYVCEPQTCAMVYLNRSFRAALGYAPVPPPDNELLSLKPLLHPEDRAPFEAALAQAAHLQDDVVAHAEYRVQHADNSWRWFYMRTSVLHRHADGTVHHVVGTIEDISERKAAETAIHHSEARLRATINESPIGIVALDTNRRFLRANRAFQALTGYTEHELASLTLDNVLTAAAEQAPLWNVLQMPNDASNRLEMVGRCHTKTGETRWVEVALVPVYDTPGHLLHTSAMVIDITERKLAQDRIQAQAELLDKAPDAIFTYDLTHHITYVNQSALSLFGWQKEEVIGTPLARWFSADAALPFENLSPQAMPQWTGEYTFSPDADAPPLTLAVRLSLIQDSGTHPSTCFFIGTDITAQKQYEERLLRTQRLESLGTLAGGMAHDLNNILNPILMGTGLLKRQELSSSAKSTLDIIESSTERGASLVKQVLTFARGIEGEKSPLQLHLVVKEVLRLIRETFPRTLTITSRLPADLPLVLADSTQLQQVLMNLCVNARDAMDANGTLVVAVKAVTVPSASTPVLPDLSPGTYVALSVHDTGVGIAADVQHKIFEPFYTTKTLQQGTGLGLSIVSGIVKSHKGAIHVDSTPHVGTTITVYLPALACEDVPTFLSPTPQATSSTEHTILIVEDESAIRQMVHKALLTEGYTVLTAPTGNQALTQFDRYNGHVDILLTDMMMPDGDGATTIQELRARAPHLKIIAASGLPLPPLQQETLGIHAFLQKPYAIATLKQTLSTVLHAETSPTT